MLDADAADEPSALTSFVCADRSSGEPTRRRRVSSVARSEPPPFLARLWEGRRRSALTLTAADGGAAGGQATPTILPEALWRVIHAYAALPLTAPVAAAGAVRPLPAYTSGCLSERQPSATTPAPKGAALREKWNTRYFVLTTGSAAGAAPPSATATVGSEEPALLCWNDWHDDPQVPLSSIPLRAVTNTPALDDVDFAVRFTVRTAARDHVFEAPSPDAAEHWVNWLQYALTVFRASIAPPPTAPTPASPTAATFGGAKAGGASAFPFARSALQDLFFRARYSSEAVDRLDVAATNALATGQPLAAVSVAVSAMTSTSSVDDAYVRTDIARHFPTDRHVLGYVLERYLNPAHQLFDYDATTYADVCLEESKLELRHMTLNPTGATLYAAGLATAPLYAGHTSAQAMGVATLVPRAVLASSGSTSSLSSGGGGDEKSLPPLSPPSSSRASVSVVSPHASSPLSTQTLLQRARSMGLSPLTLASLSRQHEQQQQQTRTPKSGAKRAGGGGTDWFGFDISGPAVTAVDLTTIVLKHSRLADAAPTPLSSKLTSAPRNVVPGSSPLDWLNALDPYDEPYRVLVLLNAPYPTRRSALGRSGAKPAGPVALTSPAAAAAAAARAVLLRDALCAVLSGPVNEKDDTTRGLALRVLWVWLHGTAVHANRIPAAREFARLCVAHCGGPRFTQAIRASLFAILTSRLQSHFAVPPTATDDGSDKPVGDPNSVANRLAAALSPRSRSGPGATFVSFHMAISHELAWEALLGCLPGSDWELRKQTLEDVSTLLYDNWPAVRSLCRPHPHWSRWVYASIADVPPNHLVTPLQRLVYAYLINVVTTVHGEHLTESPFFADSITRSLQELIEYAGLSEQSLHIAHTVLTAVINKTTSKKASFLIDTNYSTSIRWANFTALSELVRRFVFQTEWWRDWAPDERSGSAVFHWLLSADRERTAAATQHAAAATLERGTVLSPRVITGGGSGGVASGIRQFANLDSSLEHDYGLHWDSATDEPRDLPLVQRMEQLYRAFHVDSYDAANDPDAVADRNAAANAASGGADDVSRTSGTTREERDFLRRCKEASDFWKQSAQLLLLVKFPWNRALLDCDVQPTHSHLERWLCACLPAEFGFDENELRGRPLGTGTGSGGGDILSVIMEYACRPKLYRFIRDFLSADSSLGRQAVLYRLHELCSSAVTNRWSAQYAAAAAAAGVVVDAAPIAAPVIATDAAAAASPTPAPATPTAAAATDKPSVVGTAPTSDAGSTDPLPNAPIAGGGVTPNAKPRPLPVVSVPAAPARQASTTTLSLPPAKK